MILIGAHRYGDLLSDRGPWVWGDVSGRGVAL